MHVSGDYYVRSQEAVVINRSVVADVITAPQGYIITDANEWLNGVVFQNSTIFADSVLREKRTPATDVADQVISQTFSLVILLRPESVHFCITQGHKHFMISRWIKLADVFKGNHRQFKKRLSFEILLINREGDDLMLTIARKVIVSKASNVARSENY
jgi:hypothetical protein